MPIYEYRCHGCRRRVSIFFRSFSAVEEAVCPNCGSHELTRLMSRVALLRRSGEADDAGRDDDLDSGAADMLSGLDDEDPRAVARWARRMSEEMGEPMEPEFADALDRIESGEDPERVMEQLDDESDASAGDDFGGADDGLD